MRNKTHTPSTADTEDGDEDDRDLALPSHPSNSLIRDVWAHNFQEELQRIATLADEYPVISIVHLQPSRILNFQGIWSQNRPLATTIVLKNCNIRSSGTMSSRPNSYKLDSHWRRPMDLWLSPPLGSFTLPLTSTKSPQSQLPSISSSKPDCLFTTSHSMEFLLPDLQKD